MLPIFLRLFIIFYFLFISESLHSLLIWSVVYMWVAVPACTKLISSKFLSGPGQTMDFMK